MSKPKLKFGKYFRTLTVFNSSPKQRQKQAKELREIAIKYVSIKARRIIK